MATEAMKLFGEELVKFLNEKVEEYGSAQELFEALEYPEETENWAEEVSVGNMKLNLLNMKIRESRHENTVSTYLVIPMFGGILCVGVQGEYDSWTGIEWDEEIFLGTEKYSPYFSRGL